MEERTTSGCSGHSSIPNGTTTCNLTRLIQEWGEGFRGQKPWTSARVWGGCRGPVLEDRRGRTDRITSPSRCTCSCARV